MFTAALFTIDKTVATSRLKSSGDLMHNIGIIVNNTGL